MKTLGAFAAVLALGIPVSLGLAVAYYQGFWSYYGIEDEALWPSALSMHVTSYTMIMSALIQYWIWIIAAVLVVAIVTFAIGHHLIASARWVGKLTRKYAHRFLKAPESDELSAVQFGTAMFYVASVLIVALFLLVAPLHVAYRYGVSEAASHQANGFVPTKNGLFGRYECSLFRADEALELGVLLSCGEQRCAVVRPGKRIVTVPLSELLATQAMRPDGRQIKSGEHLACGSAQELIALRKAPVP